MFVRRDGSNVVVEVSASRAPMGDGYANFVFFRDVTDRKQLQAELERSRRMDSLGRLAGGIAHDFNNLISTIHSALALARGSAGDPAAVAQALAQADEATARARDLTRQLLTFSRGGEAQAVAVDPNQAVRETAGLLRLASDRVELELELAADVGKVWIDPSQLHQVLLNLLLNARDAIEGEGRIRVATERRRIDADQAHAGDWIVVEVADTGAGMTPEIQTRIFEPFFTTKPSGVGTGLGLSTVYGVVRQAGGFVEVHTQQARGTRFQVFLPALGVTTVPPESVERAQRGRGAARILICDDEVRLAALTAGLLEQHGFAAETVATGPAALELLQAGTDRFDALLLDINLSGRSARELLGDFAARGIDVPVVLSSGYAEEDVDPELSSHPSVVGYLAKPYPVQRLLELVGRAVASRARG
jgi:nitrogen-specific signal transduction histidine kinase/ActR/RegA family two-component response regulator